MRRRLSGTLLTSVPDSNSSSKLLLRWSTLIGSWGTSTNPYMYGATSGYRTEGDAGLSHVGARYYDAQVGRFITRDTDLDEPPLPLLRSRPD